MPIETYVINVTKEVWKLNVYGKVTVATPFFGSTSGRLRDEDILAKGRSLAERIETAINLAIRNFKDDFQLNDDNNLRTEVTPKS